MISNQPAPFPRYHVKNRDALRRRLTRGSHERRYVRPASGDGRRSDPAATARARSQPARARKRRRLLRLHQPARFLEGELEERDIAYRTSAAITNITADAVEVDGGGSVPSELAMIIPPLAGVEAIAASPGLANPKGFVPVDAHFRHPELDGVYAVGVAVAMAPVEETPVPVNFPKTGHMTEQMATIAARDIAARIDGRKGTTHPLAARCILDLGDRGAYMAVDPVRPPRNRVPTVSEGRRWLLAKRLFERTYLWHARRGRRIPTALGW